MMIGELESFFWLQIPSCRTERKRSDLATFSKHARLRVTDIGHCSPLRYGSSSWQISRIFQAAIGRRRGRKVEVLPHPARFHSDAIGNLQAGAGRAPSSTARFAGRPVGRPAEDHLTRRSLLLFQFAKLQAANRPSRSKKKPKNSAEQQHRN